MKNTANTDLEPINTCKTSKIVPPPPQLSTITYSSTDLLNLLGGNTFTIPIYFKAVTGQNLLAGRYNVTLNLTINWNISGQLGIGNICLNPQVSSTTLSPTVTLIIINDCSTITAPNINFGTASLLSNFPSVSQTISIICTKGSFYNVGINNGVNAVNNVRNIMKNGSELWSSANPTTISADQLTHIYNYVAKILGCQNTPTSGNYTDTLVVNIAF
ncbi:MAG: spore coat protein U domain-containing protein [Candidatus Phlomobacter fragariae]